MTDNPTTPEAAERARFEAWAKLQSLRLHRYGMNNELYGSNSTQLAFEAWNAALAAQRAKSQAHEKAQFKIWAEGKFKHIAEHMRWVTISIAEEGWMARAALAAQEGGGERVTDGWEPMVTAPMDGTVIQFLQGGEVFAGFAGDDPDHPWQFLDRNGRQAFVNGFHHKFSPRWWRPLAEAPKEAALRAAQEGTSNG